MRAEVRQTGRYPDDADRLPYFACNQSHKVFKCKRLRSNGIAEGVFLLPSSFDHQSSHVFYEDWPDRVAAIARDSEHRKMPDEPGDVVDENIFEAKNDRGTHDGVRETRLNHSLFKLSFPTVVTERRLEGWVGDADMDNAPDPGVLCSSDQSARVVDCGFKSSLAAREAHPIGIDQRRSAAK